MAVRALRLRNPGGWLPDGTDWLETAKRCGFARMSGIMARVADETPNVIATVERRLPKDFPAPVAHSIFEGLKTQARKLAVSRSG